MSSPSRTMTDIPASGLPAPASRAMGLSVSLLAGALLSLLLAAALWQGDAGRHPAGGHLPTPARARLGGRSGGALSGLPLAAQGSVSSALGRDDRAYAAVPAAGDFALSNPSQRLRARFSSEGVRIESGAVSLALSLRGYGYGNALGKVSPVAPAAHANGVIYRHGALSEWYENGPLGLEQGFTLMSAPRAAGAGPLTLALALSGNVRPSLSRAHTLTFSHAGSSLSYGGLIVTDANGRKLPSWIALTHGRLLLRIDDSGARYPLRVDPVFQEAKLTATHGEANEFFGYSVAMSGEKLVVGAPSLTVGSNHLQGAVYLFGHSSSGWTQEAMLTNSGGAAEEYFGWSVAISPDETIVVGAPGVLSHSSVSIGAAYVFARRFVSAGQFGAFVWTQLAKLTASNGVPGDNLGFSTAISGGTVVAGALGVKLGPNVDQGAAYVFTEPSGGWKDENQQAELTASGGREEDQLGHAVAVSGAVVVAGAPNANAGPSPKEGAVYVFIEPSGGWSDESQQAELSASAGATSLSLGETVAMSGATVVAGAPGSDGLHGAAYVFTEPSGGWSSENQQAELTASKGSESSFLGSSVAISGNTVIAGAPETDVGLNPLQGEAFLFTEPASGWSDETQQETLEAASPSEDEQLGWSVAVSGETYVAGAKSATVGSNVDQGAAYVFGFRPEQEHKGPEILFNPCERGLPPCNGQPHRVTPAETHIVYLTSQVGGSLPYTITANDPEAAITSLSCSPGGLQGSLRIGTETLHCQATDSQGATSSGSITVALIDDTPPEIKVPENITVPAQGPAGARVAYSVTASDPYSAISSESCTPASGATFPIGETTVTCSAVDARGNSAEASFKVTVTPFEIPFKKWSLKGSLKLHRLGQTVVLPVGSSFNGHATFAGEAGTLEGNTFVPPFESELRLPGLPPVRVRWEWVDHPTVTGTILAPSEPSPWKINAGFQQEIRITAVNLLGLTIPAACETTKAVSFPLEDSLTENQLLSTGATFTGQTTLPAFRCSGGLLGPILSATLTAWLSGPSNAFTFTIAP